MFQARGPAAAKQRSPNDDSVCGTATVMASADLRPALALATADGVMRGLASLEDVCAAGVRDSPAV